MPIPLEINTTMQPRVGDTAVLMMVIIGIVPTFWTG
ncbi:MAG: hypothetical protein CM1200mP6_03110 [Anaerolineaceae bacterium]|nr:MAG: hypothetical protein CM1200mP6_03110 [Anaerolineaceae bacterium]